MYQCSFLDIFTYWILIIVNSYLEYSKLQLTTCDITLETKYGYDIYLEEKKTMFKQLNNFH